MRPQGSLLITLIAAVAVSAARSSGSAGQVPGQQPPDSRASAQQPSEPRFSAGTDLVVLHATVKDRRGAYVTGLTREAFTVLEDGAPQPVSLFTSEDAPVTVGLVVDNSGSMWANRPQVIAAAQAFARSSNPDDEIFALVFDDDVRAALPAEEPFTKDPATLSAALTRALTTRGRTALFDAIAQGLAYLDRGVMERKVLVLVSDGGDNASQATFADILRQAQSSNALIYTVALLDDAGKDANPRLLRQIAEATGGEGFTPDNANEISQVLRRIARDIRHTYTLGYVPANAVRDGTFRSVRLLVGSSSGRRLVARTRAGYVAAASRVERQP